MTSGRELSLPDALRSRSLLGTFMLVPRVEIAELLGEAGFDVVILDLEHGPLVVSDLPALAAGIRGAGLYAIARIGVATEAEIAAVLDTGVDGIIVPHVSSRDEAAAVVSASRYPPQGLRSLNPYVRALSYGALTDLAAANALVAVMVMVEGIAGVDALDELARVDGLDGVFVGPVDLSAALGVPGQPEHPTVVAAVHDVFRRLAGSGTAGAIYAPTAEAASRWFEAGASLVALSTDTAIFRQGAHVAAAGVRTLHQGAPGAANELPSGAAS